jgi:molybdenum cofactor cytidylyltransferase
MSSFVRVGIKALVAANPQTAAVVLMLRDQPLVTREIIAGLVVAYLETGYPIVASRYCYGGSFGALPALFGSAYFGELTALKGEAGAKQVIQNISEKLTCCLSPEARSTWTRKTISRVCNRRIIPTRPRAQT